jgi:hypothetical protein
MRCYVALVGGWLPTMKPLGHPLTKVTAPHPRRLDSSATRLWETQIRCQFYIIFHTIILFQGNWEIYAAHLLIPKIQRIQCLFLAGLFTAHINKAHIKCNIDSRDVKVLFKKFSWYKSEMIQTLCSGRKFNPDRAHYRKFTFLTDLCRCYYEYWL